MKTLIKYIIDLVIAFESIFVSPEKHSGEKRVLILRKDGLGDCLLFYPTLATYREFYKNAKITLVFPSIFKSLSSLLNEMDEVIWFDHGAFRSSFVYRRAFMLNLKRKGYDIAIYPVYSKEEIALTMLKKTRAESIITFDDVKTVNENEIERNVDFTEHVTGIKPEIFFPSISTKILPSSKIIPPSDPYVVVFPGTSFALYRRWPCSRFVLVIEKLVKHGIIPVICGSPNEVSLSEEILSKVDPISKKKVMNISGKTDFSDLAHLLKNAEFYFGSDTGVLHLSTAVGTPTIGIIGSGGYRRFFPYGNLSINRALYDTKSMEGEIPIGTWEGVEKFPASKPHPSIERITSDQALAEIDFMLKFLYQKKS